MWHRHAGASGTSETVGLAVRDLWEVAADPSYDVHCRALGRQVVAVRTLAGEGLLECDHFQATPVTSETLVFVERAHLHRYRCTAASWSFWWFCFLPSGPPAFPLYRLLQIPARPRDAEDFHAAFAALRRETFSQRSYASSVVSMMFHRWLCSWRREHRRTRHQATIEALIDQMHDRIGEAWRVSDMARTAGMSERGFRAAFRGLTGQGPKAYYDRLRLNSAQQLLRLGIYTVAEVASQLGFSSAFHLSKAYRRHFGVPPSSALPEGSGQIQ